MTSEQEGSQDFRKFVILVCIEAVVVTAIAAPNNPGAPWWLWGLLMFTPVGWVIPGIALWLINSFSGANRDQSPPPHRSIVHAVESAYSRLPSDWEVALRLQGLDLPSFYSNVDDLYQQHHDRVCPSRKDIFRAFHLTPITTVQVVLLGQDPYPNGRLADGLAFSQRGAPEPNSALNRILLNLKDDPSIGARVPTTGDLEPWSRQGVLLLNLALTVEEGKSGSHLHQWGSVSQMILKAIYQRRPDAVYICFGRPAIDAVRSINPFTTRVNIVSTAHPMARDLEDSSLRRFQDSHPFSEANELLLARGHAPIRWALP